MGATALTARLCWAYPPLNVHCFGIRFISLSQELKVIQAHTQESIVHSPTISPLRTLECIPNGVSYE